MDEKNVLWEAMRKELPSVETPTSKPRIEELKAALDAERDRLREARDARIAELEAERDQLNAALAETAARCDMYRAERDRLREALRTALGILESVPELNMSNYDHEDVCDLNNRSVEAVLYLRKALEE